MALPDRRTLIAEIFQAIEAIDEWERRGRAIFEAYAVLDVRRDDAIRSWLAGPREEDKPLRFPEREWGELAEAFKRCSEELPNEVRKRCRDKLRAAAESIGGDAQGEYYRARGPTSLAQTGSSRGTERSLAEAMEAGARIDHPAWQDRWLAWAFASGLLPEATALPSTALRTLLQDIADRSIEDVELIEDAASVHYRQELLEGLARRGLVNAIEATELVDAMYKGPWRARAGAAFSPLIRDGGTRRRILEQALADASVLDDERDADIPIGTLAAAAATIGDVRLAESLAENIAEPANRVPALLAVGRRRSSEMHFRLALNIVKEHEPWEKAKLLTDVALAAPEPIAAEARTELLYDVQLGGDEPYPGWIPSLKELAGKAPFVFVKKFTPGASEARKRIRCRVSRQQHCGGGRFWSGQGRGRTELGGSSGNTRSYDPPRTCQNRPPLPHSPTYLRAEAVAEALVQVLADDPGQGDAEAPNPCATGRRAWRL
ncbi:MAG: hypothetical protein M3198_07090 [Actinomycetota bacterium]|nr:hypothetical protein [Actinomycetota bacterium]